MVLHGMTPVCPDDAGRCPTPVVRRPFDNDQEERPPDVPAKAGGFGDLVIRANGCWVRLGPPPACGRGAVSR